MLHVTQTIHTIHRIFCSYYDPVVKSPKPYGLNKSISSAPILLDFTGVVNFFCRMSSAWNTMLNFLLEFARVNLNYCTESMNGCVVEGRKLQGRQAVMRADSERSIGRSPPKSQLILCYLQKMGEILLFDCPVYCTKFTFKYSGIRKMQWLVKL